MSIAGNQFFTGIVNQPTTVPDLSVNRLITGQTTSGATVVSSLTASGLVTAQNGLTVSSGATTLGSTLNVTGVVTAQNGLTVSSGATTLGSTLNVTGVVTAITSSFQNTLSSPTITNIIDYNGMNSNANMSIDSTNNIAIRAGNIFLVPITSNLVVGIGTIFPNANAILDITSTTKAFMPPRMTSIQKSAIPSPTAGMMVYDTTLNKLSVYGASAWETITSV